MNPVFFEWIKMKTDRLGVVVRELQYNGNYMLSMEFAEIMKDLTDYWTYGFNVEDNTPYREHRE